jgi:hypothetical protein
MAAPMGERRVMNDEEVTGQDMNGWNVKGANVNS